MQIHEVTAGQLKAGAKKIGAGAWDLTKGVASGIGDELETMAFGSPISRYDTSEPATEPSLELIKKATASLQGGPALTAQELKQVNDYRVSKGQKPITAANLAAATTTATAPPPANTKTTVTPQNFNAANIMQQPGMQKYAEKPKPNYAQTGQMNYKPATVTTNAAPKVNPAAAPVIYTLDGRSLDPKNLGDAGVIKQLQAQGLTSGYLK
jgi:hypothetical protein